MPFIMPFTMPSMKPFITPFIAPDPNKLDRADAPPNGPRAKAPNPSIPAGPFSAFRTPLNIFLNMFSLAIHDIVYSKEAGLEVFAYFILYLYANSV